MSDSRSGSTRFQDWLTSQLEARDWSQAKLAREIDVFKGTVGRWLMPVDTPMFRVPSYESCRRLADLFGVERRFILELAGIDDFSRERNLTTLQEDTIAVVSMLGDDVLKTVYPQLRALLDEKAHERIQELKAEEAKTRARKRATSGAR